MILLGKDRSPSHLCHCFAIGELNETKYLCTVSSTVGSDFAATFTVVYLCCIFLSSSKKFSISKYVI